MKKNSQRKQNDDLAQKFIQEAGSLELTPPNYNSAVFVQASGWNMEKYFKRYYSNTSPFPVLINVKENEGMQYWLVGKVKEIAEEIFLRYWGRSVILKGIVNRYHQLAHKNDLLYRTSSYLFIKENNPKKINRLLSQMKDVLWSLNALLMFTVYFDKELCRSLLLKLKISPTSIDIDNIWERATDPITYSFARRREVYFLKLFLKGYSWERLAEKCQYFEASYDQVLSKNLVQGIFYKKYGNLSKSSAKKKLQLIEKGQAIKEKEYRKWLRSLNKDQQKLVIYLQAIMELRDIRKDDIAKFYTAMYRVAERIFAEAGVSHKLIMYYTFDELLKGPDYLISHAKEVRERKKGFTALVHYNGQIEYQIGLFNQTKKILHDFFMKNRGSNLRELRGQVGSPGRTKGKIKIILNIIAESKRFKKGDILVTGMTRPEFVPLMRRALAVITDEGGITCHAAIVSRELGIPCIIGTKIATQVFKDGDLVEVDANKGVVRKLKK